MSTKNSLALFRAVKSDYAYLIALMGFSWGVMYGYAGTCYFHDVLATFALLLATRSAWMHFALLTLLVMVPLGRYPLLTLTDLPSDNFFVLLWTNPLNTFALSTQLPLSGIVPPIILLVLMGVLTTLQRRKSPGFNVLRVEFFCVFISTLVFTALFNVLHDGYRWAAIDYPPLRDAIAFILSR